MLITSSYYIAMGAGLLYRRGNSTIFTRSLRIKSSLCFPKKNCLTTVHAQVRKHLNNNSSLCNITTAIFYTYILIRIPNPAKSNGCFPSNVHTITSLQRTFFISYYFTYYYITQSQLIQIDWNLILKYIFNIPNTFKE